MPIHVVIRTSEWMMFPLTWKVSLDPLEGVRQGPFVLGVDDGDGGDRRTVLRSIVRHVSPIINPIAGFTARPLASAGFRCIRIVGRAVVIPEKATIGACSPVNRSGVSRFHGAGTRAVNHRRVGLLVVLT